MLNMYDRIRCILYIIRYSNIIILKTKNKIGNEFSFIKNE